jgi:hypothetical protein
MILGPWAEIGGSLDEVGFARPLEGDVREDVRRLGQGQQAEAA